VRRETEQKKMVLVRGEGLMGLCIWATEIECGKAADGIAKLGGMLCVW